MNRRQNGSSRTKGPICGRAFRFSEGESGGLPHGGFGFGGLGHDAELLHQAQGVPVDMPFHHLSANEPRDSYARDGELLSRRRNPTQFASMFTPAGPRR